MTRTLEGIHLHKQERHSLGFTIEHQTCEEDWTGALLSFKVDEEGQAEGLEGKLWLDVK